jgi:predicted small secreted protein|tara:strand:+ start:315 stop:548 length:234 start_codon:yes stop_codon:yes gene_type:complete
MFTLGEYTFKIFDLSQVRERFSRCRVVPVKPNEDIMTKLITTAALLFSLGACATIEGAGEDIEAAGEAISEEAREAS